MKKIFLPLLLVFAFFNLSKAQFGIGVVGGNDIYQRYTNPTDETGESRSAGNAILNLTLGPKVWVGGENFSISVESHINWGSTAFSVQDFKGMGAMAFPILAKLNFNGNSGFNSELTTGFSVGGGVQYAKTELYGLNAPYIDRGVTRTFYPVAVGEISYGYGIAGFVIELFGRYGYNTNTKAQTLNVGIAYNFNLGGLLKLKRKVKALEDL